MDEISDIPGECNIPKGGKSIFDLTETSFIKKNSMNLQLKEILSISQDDKSF